MISFLGYPEKRFPRIAPDNVVLHSGSRDYGIGLRRPVRVLMFISRRGKIRAICGRRGKSFLEKLAANSISAASPTANRFHSFPRRGAAVLSSDRTTPRRERSAVILEDEKVEIPAA